MPVLRLVAPDVAPLIAALLEGVDGSPLPMRGEWGWGGRYRSAILRKDPCWNCGKPPVRPLRRWTVDHLVPRCRGGTRDIRTNLAGMCGECNTAKSDLEPLQFLAMEALYRAGRKVRHIGRRRRKRLRRKLRKLQEKLAA